MVKCDFLTLEVFLLFYRFHTPYLSIISETSLVRAGYLFISTFIVWMLATVFLLFEGASKIM